MLDKLILMITSLSKFRHESHLDWVQGCSDWSQKDDDVMEDHFQVRLVVESYKHSPKTDKTDITGLSQVVISRNLSPPQSPVRTFWLIVTTLKLWSSPRLTTTSVPIRDKYKRQESSVSKSGSWQSLGRKWVDTVTNAGQGFQLSSSPLFASCVVVTSLMMLLLSPSLVPSQPGSVSKVDITTLGARVGVRYQFISAVPVVIITGNKYFSSSFSYANM